jgi:hypothetical protein
MLVLCRHGLKKPFEHNKRRFLQSRILVFFEKISMDKG